MLHGYPCSLLRQLEAGEGDNRPRRQQPTDRPPLTGNQATGVPGGSVSFFVCGPLTSAVGSPERRRGRRKCRSRPGPAPASQCPVHPARSRHVLLPGATTAGRSNFLASSRTAPRASAFTVSRGDAQPSVTPGEATTTTAAGDTGHVVDDRGRAGGPREADRQRHVLRVRAADHRPQPVRRASAGTKVGLGAVNLTAGSGSTAVATSPVFKPTRPGTWCLRAEYSWLMAATTRPPTVQLRTASQSRKRRRRLSGSAPRSTGGSMRSVRRRGPGALRLPGEQTADRGLASCDGTVANDSRPPTKAPGTHPLTVTARSLDGREAQARRPPPTRLPPDNHITIPARQSGKLHGGVRGSIQRHDLAACQGPRPGSD